MRRATVRKGDGPQAFFAALAVTVVGLIWLLGGLALNRFFYYPIILIIVGIIGMITNAAGLVRRRPQLPQPRLPYGVPPSQGMFYPPQPQPQMAPPPGLCWQCGQPNEGRPVCATCGAAQYIQLPQQPMSPYGAAPGYPPAPMQPPSVNGWPPPPQQPPHSQGW